MMDYKIIGKKTFDQDLRKKEGKKTILENSRMMTNSVCRRDFILLFYQIPIAKPISKINKH